MTNKKLAYDEMICHECGEIAFANFVDIGVGMQQCEPYHCDNCHWIQGCPGKDTKACKQCVSFFDCYAKDLYKIDVES